MKRQLLTHEGSCDVSRPPEIACRLAPEASERNSLHAGGPRSRSRVAPQRTVTGSVPRPLAGLWRTMSICRNAASTALVHRSGGLAVDDDSTTAGFEAPARPVLVRDTLGGDDRPYVPKSFAMAQIRRRRQCLDFRVRDVHDIAWRGRIGSAFPLQRGAPPSGTGHDVGVGIRSRTSTSADRGPRDAPPTSRARGPPRLPITNRRAPHRTGANAGVDTAACCEAGMPDGHRRFTSTVARVTLRTR